MQKRMVLLFLSFIVLICPATGLGSSLTLGSANDGNCLPFNCNDSGTHEGQAIEYQQVFSGAQFGPSPVLITGITFFDEFLPGFGFDNTPLLSGSYAISFAITTKGVGNLAANLPDNISSGRAVFIATTSVGVSAGFGTLTFTGTNPYLFDPALGNLLLDIVVTNQAAVDSASYSPANGFDSDNTGIAMSRAFKIGTQGAIVDNTGLVTRFEYALADVPEPGTIVLMALGLAVIIALKNGRSSHRGTFVKAALSIVGLAGHAIGQPITQRPIRMTVQGPRIGTSSVSTGPGGVTIPYFSRSYVIDGQTYPQAFVGTDPAVSNFTTNINVPLVPVILVLNSGAGPTFDPTKRLNTAPPGSALSALLSTVTSPLFQVTNYVAGGITVGTGTQYGDAIQRATFWDAVSATSPSWHTNLKYQLRPSVTLNVPTDRGSAFGPLAVVDRSWLRQQLDSLAPNYGFTNFPLFLAYEVLQSDDDGMTCCVLGYHTALQVGANVQTYGMGSFLDPFQLDGGVADVSVLSSEILGWLNDPFSSNIVPDWPAPFSFVPPGPPYTPGQCQSTLEPASAVEDRADAGSVVFNMTTFGRVYTLQNGALAPWFLRISPSFAVNGWYTFLGPVDSEFASPAPACPAVN